MLLKITVVLYRRQLEQTSPVACDMALSTLLLILMIITIWVNLFCVFFLCVCRCVSQVSTGWEEFYLEETVCSVSVTTTPQSATSMEFVWWVFNVLSTAVAELITSFSGHQSHFKLAVKSLSVCCNHLQPSSPLVGRMFSQQVASVETLTKCLFVFQGCTHNTTGPHCDQCLPGFYGDAIEGTGDDCRLCPCPLTELSNRFGLNKLIKGGAA